MMLGHPHPKGEWMFSYRYMQMKMQGNQSGTNPVDNYTLFNQYLMVPEQMLMDMHMLMAMYGFTDRFSAMLMLNYSVNTMYMQMLPGSMHNMPGMDHHANTQEQMTMNTKGVGDTKLYLSYGLVQNEKHMLVASGGVSFPTGSISQTDKVDGMYQGKRLPYMMQNGSGTVDFMPTLTYTYSPSRFTFSAQTNITWRPFYNQYGYNLGNDMSLNVWGSYALLPQLSFSLREEAYASTTIDGRDPSLYRFMEPGANPANSGGQRLSTFAGVNAYLAPKNWPAQKLGIEYGMPLYQNLNGYQMSNRHTFYVSWTTLF
jgi:hypothetical protein